MSPVVEENQTSIQPGWVKLSRGTHGRTVRDYGPHDLTTKKSILPEQQNVVELLEHNIDLSFEFEKTGIIIHINKNMSLRLITRLIVNQRKKKKTNTLCYI